MTRCTTIDQSVLEVTKVEKVLPRLVKRGDDQGKKFAQKVLGNAADVTKQKIADEKAAQGQVQNAGDIKTPVDTPRSSTLNESKNSRSIDIKRGDKGAINRTASNSEARQPPSKIDAKASTKPSVADGSSIKLKGNAVTAKPSGFFSSLQSASKKPGTSSKLKDSKPR